MKKINQIIANGILSLENVPELLAQAIEANSDLATFLCGDNPCPEGAENKAKEFCQTNKYNFVSVGDPKLDRNFNWEVRVNYTKTRYAKTPDQKSSYDTKAEPEDEYQFPIEIKDWSDINL